LYGPIIFLFLYALATLCFLPGGLLTLGLGYTFHHAYDSTPIALTVGGIIVLLGAQLCATGQLLLGRFVLRAYLYEWALSKRLFLALDKAVVHDGLKIIFILRMCPMVPYTLFNYLLGLTDVRLRDFVPAGLGMLPGILVRLFVGSTLAALTKESVSISTILREGENSGLIVALIAGGAIVGISGIAYSVRLTKGYLRQLEESVTPKDIQVAAHKRMSFRVEGGRQTLLLQPGNRDRI
jgi:uncharacterized membrane protein YdjX (TVP38/TMEM64 family)